MPKSALLAAVLFATPLAAQAAPAYVLAKTTPVGAPDRWDYAVFEASTARVYLAHGDRLAVLDAASGALVGEVSGIGGGTHGTAISTATGQGFTDDGKSGLAVAFDLKTLRIKAHIPVQTDADAITADARTGHVFVVEGDPGKVSVIDPKTDAVIATIDGGEKMEYAAGDGEGAIFVAGEEKRDLLKIDTLTNAVVARWPAPDCASPHGLAVDRKARRLFMGCVNGVMMVMDAKDGRVIAKLPIGLGSDAIAFDPVRGRVFSSNGRDGTVSIYQQTSPDRYEALETLQTAVSGRTMAVDPVSGRMFVAAAETTPSPTPGGRPRPTPGSLKVLIYDPVPAGR